MRPSRARLLAVLLLATVAPPAAGAASVRALAVAHRDGQTAITWDNAAGTGWRYRVYASPVAIADGPAPATLELLATVADSSALDVRLSLLLDSLVTFRTDSVAAPLPLARGLFVATARLAGPRWFAVTAESAGAGEDRWLVAGVNATALPVMEQPDPVRPVWQRTLASGVAVHVLWSTRFATPGNPVTARQEGVPHHVGVLRGAPGGPLVVSGHGRGGSFLNAAAGLGFAGESVVAPDDALPTRDRASFYLGYGEDYNLSVFTNPVPEPPAVIEDHTERRVLHLLDWAERELGHDPGRVYAVGGSMGGSFAWFLGWRHPRRIAATLSIIPRLVLAQDPEPFPELRESLERLWGRAGDALTLPSGEPAWEAMDARAQARRRRADGGPPQWVFAGRADTVTGWWEKVAAAAAADSHRAGTRWFWDTREHYTPNAASAWATLQQGAMLATVRADQSFPACTRPSLAEAMGDGDPLVGDSVGTRGGDIAWDGPPVDLPDRWEVVLRLTDLPVRGGIRAAPESLRTDVTPRRLQRFPVLPRVRYRWTAHDLMSGALLAEDLAQPDADGVLVCTQVPIRRTGVRLAVGFDDPASVPDPGAAPWAWLAPRAPGGAIEWRARWRAEGEVRVELFDALGRRLRHERHTARAGREDAGRIARDGLAPGLHLLRFRDRAGTATLRVLVLR